MGRSRCREEGEEGEEEEKLHILKSKKCITSVVNKIVFLIL